jgi:hypothetical protein
MRTLSVMAHLPEMEKRIKELEKMIADLKKDVH